jgi:hypothetical protein
VVVHAHAGRAEEADPFSVCDRRDLYESQIRVDSSFGCDPFDKLAGCVVMRAARDEEKLDGQSGHGSRVAAWCDTRLVIDELHTAAEALTLFALQSLSPVAP